MVPLVVWTVVYTEKGNEIRKHATQEPDDNWFNWRFFCLLYGVLTPDVIKKWKYENTTIATGMSIEGEDFHEGDGYTIRWFISWFQENGFDVKINKNESTHIVLHLFPQSDFA